MRGQAWVQCLFAYCIFRGGAVCSNCFVFMFIFRFFVKVYVIVLNCRYLQHLIYSVLPNTEGEGSFPHVMRS